MNLNSSRRRVPLSRNQGIWTNLRRRALQEPKAPFVLISAPFAPLCSPSIGLSILKSLGDQAGRPTLVWYANLRFAQVVGESLYDAIATCGSNITDLPGEWLFSPKNARSQDLEYINDVLLSRSHVRTPNQKQDSIGLGLFAEELLAAKPLAQLFSTSEAKEVSRLRPLLVGFTLTFQQIRASLAMAAVLKRIVPNVPIVFGGPSCESPMGDELFEHHDCIDALVQGEGEPAFDELLEYASSGRTRQSVSRGGRVDLGLLPMPDYRDYFAQRNALSVPLKTLTVLPYESSRGCWWGQKSQCVFCGLNSARVAYTSKPSVQVIDELKQLANTHGDLSVVFVDTILDFRYLRDVLPALAALGLPNSLMIETKANLSHDALTAMRQAGIKAIQPGVESLIDDVLLRMRKGTTALANVRLLRDCRELAIRANWNWLWGLPHEDVSEYDRVVDVLPSLEHLHPPITCGAIRLDRYSPLFEDRCGSLVGVAPYPAYRYVFPEYSDDALENVACYFTYKHADGRNVESYVSRLAAAIDRWRYNHRLSEFVSMKAGSELLLWDSRAVATAPVRCLSKLQRAIVLTAARPVRKDSLVAALGEWSATKVQEAIDGLEDQRVLARNIDRYVALPIPLECYHLTPFSLQTLVERCGFETQRLAECGGPAAAAYSAWTAGAARC